MMFKQFKTRNGLSFYTEAYIDNVFQAQQSPTKWD